MLTPSQEFEQLLDRYRVTEGLCAPEQAGAPEDPQPYPRRAGDTGAMQDQADDTPVIRVYGALWRRSPLG